MNDTDNDRDAIKEMTLTDFIAARPSETGSHVQLMMALDGESTVVSVPFEQTLPLAFTIIRMEEECRRLMRPDAKTYPVLMVAGIQTGVSELGDPSLILVTDQGVKLSFAFTRARLVELLTAIASIQEMTAKRGSEPLN